MQLMRLLRVYFEVGNKKVNFLNKETHLDNFVRDCSEHIINKRSLKKYVGFPGFVLIQQNELMTDEGLTFHTINIMRRKYMEALNITPNIYYPNLVSVTDKADSIMQPPNVTTSQPPGANPIPQTAQSIRERTAINTAYFQYHNNNNIAFHINYRPIVVHDIQPVATQGNKLIPQGNNSENLYPRGYEKIYVKEPKYKEFTEGFLNRSFGTTDSIYEYVKLESFDKKIVKKNHAEIAIKLIEPNIVHLGNPDDIYDENSFPKSPIADCQHMFFKNIETRKKELENFLGGFEESKEYNKNILVNFKEINKKINDKVEKYKTISE